LKIRLIVTLLIGLGVITLCNPVSSTDITAPITLTNAGYYRLMNDLTNSPGDCIVIRGSHIVLDGNGHTLSGTGQNSGVFVNGDGLINVTIKNINVNHFGNGIKVLGVTQGSDEHQITYSSIDNCKLDNNNNGIYLDAVHDFGITNNEIENNVNSGIEPGNWAIGELFIYHNLIKNNQQYGINFFNQTWGSGGMVIVNNEISNSNTGLLLGAVHKLNIIQDNKIQNNNIGLSISSSGSTIVDNLFDNTINIGTASGTNTWNMPLKLGQNIVGGPYLGGNAWFQPNGMGFSQITPDSNNDGICNAAYIIGAGNIDNYPLHQWSSPTPTPTITIQPTTVIPTASPTPVSINQITLLPGWNSISIPETLASGANTGAIFNNVNTSGHSTWIYNSINQNWDKMTQTTTIQPLYGIWIYSSSQTNVPLQFLNDPLQPPPTRQLEQGWNSVGFTGGNPASAKDTLISVKNEWTQAMGFDSGNQVYETQIINGGSGLFSDSRLMYPTKGYWLYMTDRGQLAAIG
jgi:hypothetical protein